MGLYNFTLKDLKKELGDGLGIRSNSYAVVVPLPYAGSRKLAVLAKSTSLPERNVGTIDLYHKGRRYKVRGETDLNGSYTINLTDDANMNLRKYFDAWLKSVDDTSSIEDSSNLLNDLSDGLWNDAVNTLSGTVRAVSEMASSFTSWTDLAVGTLKDTISDNQILAPYQVEVDVYQLDRNGNPIYGYRLQNCFPTEVGAVEISDENADQLSEFSVQLCYSDFIPIDPNQSNTSKILGAVVGESATKLPSNISTALSSVKDVAETLF